MRSSGAVQAAVLDFVLHRQQRQARRPVRHGVVIELLGDARRLGQFALQRQQQALAGNALAQDEEVARADLPFEYMLNALRLRNGFGLRDFTERTGLAITAIEAGLQEAERKGLIERDFARVRPTVRGFDFLSDLQTLFLQE